MLDLFFNQQLATRTTNITKYAFAYLQLGLIMQMFYYYFNVPSLLLGMVIGLSAQQIKSLNDVITNPYTQYALTMGKRYYNVAFYVITNLSEFTQIMVEFLSIHAVQGLAIVRDLLGNMRRINLDVQPDVSTVLPPSINPELTETVLPPSINPELTETVLPVINTECVSDFPETQVDDELVSKTADIPVPMEIDN